jgi:hypothetical protein
MGQFMAVKQEIEPTLLDLAEAIEELPIVGRDRRSLQTQVVGGVEILARAAERGDFNLSVEVLAQATLGWIAVLTPRVGKKGAELVKDGWRKLRQAEVDSG